VLRLLLVLAVLVPGLAVALSSQYAALLLYLWYAIFRPQDYVYSDLSQFRFSLIIGILVLAPGLFSGRRPRLDSPLGRCILLFLAGATLAQVDAVKPGVGLQWLDYLLRLGLICLMVQALCDTQQRVLQVVSVIAGSFAFYSTKAGLLSLLGGGVRFTDGFGGAFIDNNGYALGALMVLPFLLVAAQNPRKWVRLGFVAAIPLTAYAAISTFSRGGFLALVACIAALAALQRQRIRIFVIGVPILVAGVALAPVPDGYLDRLQTIRTYQEVGEDSAISRLHFWQVAWTMAKDHPLGIGLRNFEATYDRYDTTNGRYGRERSVHNSHLQVLTEAGFIAFAAYLATYFVVFRAAFRARRFAREPGLDPDTSRFLWTTANAVIASLVAFIVGGSFIALAFNDLLWLTFAIGMSVEAVGRSVTAQLAAPMPVVSVEPLPCAPAAIRPAAIQPPRAGRQRIRFVTRSVHQVGS
jgi:putative inorganic carbon (HCO3(-)) transporter